MLQNRNRRIITELDMKKERYNETKTETKTPTRQRIPKQSRS